MLWTVVCVSLQLVKKYATSRLFLQNPFESFLIPLGLVVVTVVIEVIVVIVASLVIVVLSLLRLLRLLQLLQLLLLL